MRKVMCHTIHSKMPIKYFLKFTHDPICLSSEAEKIHTLLARVDRFLSTIVVEKSHAAAMSSFVLFSCITLVPKLVWNMHPCTHARNRAWYKSVFGEPLH